MHLHFSPSMKTITISSSNGGFLDFMKIKVAARHISYRTLFHTVLILAFLLPFVFILTAVVTLEGVNKCSSLHCLGRRLGPRLLGRTDDSVRLVRDLYKILNQVSSEEIPDGLKVPESFNQLVSEIKNHQYDAKTFAIQLKAMVVGKLGRQYPREVQEMVFGYRKTCKDNSQMEKFERELRASKFAELANKHFAASAIPKGIHCLSLRLTDEYSSNAHARKQLPSPELLPFLSENSYHHFVVASDNILAASVVVSSTIQSSTKPEKIVFHVITDKKTYAGMHSWFALNPVYPAMVEVKGVHQFDWLTRENVPVLEAVESHNGIRDYYHGNHMAGANLSEITPRKFASKLQARSPKYISLLNHLRIYLPEMVRNNKKKTASKQPTQGDRLCDLVDKVENFTVATEKSLGEFCAQSKRTNQTLNSIWRAIKSSATNGQRGFGARATKSVTLARGRGIPVGGFMLDVRVVGDFTTNMGSVGRGRGSSNPTNLDTQFNEEGAVFMLNSFDGLDVEDMGNNKNFGNSEERDHVPIRKEIPLPLRKTRPESSTRGSLCPNPECGECRNRSL
ncbi:hypothetical protein GIB67_007241 [Kingdonia uniflora]|uniref:Hexosyltransferase n=1 Tax=Kingdonia uniflora TaxID=39325 RepID=A0A7J7NXC4_9MAGN|nr:hypothetical protein GIB67_007241 [Kingdonia uniflora]